MKHTVHHRGEGDTAGHKHTCNLTDFSWIAEYKQVVRVENVSLAANKQARVSNCETLVVHTVHRSEEIKYQVNVHNYKL